MAEENPYYEGLDAYEILGVPRTADRAAIKAAFRKQVAAWHPDKFPHDADKKREGNLRMEKINRAWYILGDEDRRKRYDLYGDKGVGTSAASEERLKRAGGPGVGGFGGFGGVDFGDFGGAVDLGDIGDLFESFFSGGGGGGGARGKATGRGAAGANAAVRGDDVEVEVELPFMTSLFGGRETVRVRRLEECRNCSGSGVKPGAQLRQCRACGGKGQSVSVQRTPFGAFQTIAACDACRGTGQEYDEACGACRGRGATSEAAEVTLPIPTGVETGNVLRVKDAGHAGRRGGPRGDLVALLKVRKDARFTRQGADILSEETVSLVDAALGAKIAAQTVDGVVDVQLPPGTQPGQKLRIRGAGSPRTGGSAKQRGDAVVTVKVAVPTALSPEERALFEQLRALQRPTAP